MSADLSRSPAEVGEQSLTMNETEWEPSQSQQREKEHVSVLLDISEDIGYDDKEPLESLSGWEEAVQGWGPSPPLSCLFQPLRRGRPSRTTDPADYHCLLCADLKFCEPPGPEKGLHIPVSHSGAPRCDPQGSPPSFRPGHTYVPHNRPSAVRRSPCAVPRSPSLPCRPPAPPSEPPVVCGRPPLSSSPSPPVIDPSSDTEAPVSPRQPSLNKTSQQPSVRDKLSSEEVEEEDRGGDLSEGLSPPPPLAGPPSRPPPLLEVSDAAQLEESGGNMKLIINTFSILPPVRASTQTRLPGAPGLPRRAEPASGHREGPLWEEDASPGTAGESGGAEREEEMRPGWVPESSHPALTSAYLATTQSHGLLSALQFHRRPAAPLLGLADPAARPPCPLGGHVRQDPRTSSAHRLVFGTKPKNVRHVQPQLPTLMGTRVRIPVSPHRLL